MKKLLMWLGAALATVLLTFSVLAVYVVFVLNPNDFKAELASLVKAKTDMTLRLDGQLAWQLYPNIGIKLGSTTLTDPALKEDLAAIQSASVSVELMPLLTKKIRINAIDLDGAELRYVQYANGKTSWDHLLEKLKNPDDKESKQISLAIKALSIKNTRITAIDEATHVSRLLEQVTVQAKNIDLKEEFPLQASFRFSQKDGAGKTLQADNTIKTRIKLNVEAKQYLLNELALTTQLSGSSLPATAKLDLKAAQINADLGQQKVYLTGLELQANYADKARPEPMTMALKTAAVIDLAAGSAVLDTLHINGSFSDKSLPKALPFSMNSDIAANWKTGRFALSKLSAQVANIHLTGRLNANLPALASGAKPVTQGMTLNGMIAVASFDPRQLLAMLGKPAPVTRSSAVLHKVALHADISGTEKDVMARNLVLQLDGSHLTGEAGVKELPAARLVAQLAIDAINIDDYLPPEPSAKAATSTASESSDVRTQKAAVALLPVDLLRKQNIDIALSAGQLTVVTYPITSFRLAAAARGGLVQVSELRGNINKGSFSIPMTIDVRGAQPAIAMTPNLKDIDLGPLALKALKKDTFAGRLNFQGNVKVTGNNADAWLRSAQGPNTLHLDQGLIKGVNVVDALFAALGKYQVLLPALTGRDTTSLKGQVQNTEIVNLLGDMGLSQGVVTNKAMTADLKTIQVAGAGTYNLISQDVDYRFQLKVDKKLWGAKYAKMADYPIPVRCNGNLKGSVATLCGLDQQGMQGLLAQMAQARLSDKLDEEKGKLQDKLGQKLGDKLNPQQQEAVKKLFDLFTPH